MTDTRLLSEFRARLAERNNLLEGRTAKACRERTCTHTHMTADSTTARKAGADWCRFNLTADEASIYIFDEIGMWGTSAQSFVDQLNAVSTPKITVYLNSPGGEVFDGIAIHTALAMSKAHVTTFVTGVAASAASFIAMAGDNIKMARNATMMIHDASGLAWGNAATMRQEADLLDKLSDNIADMYQMQAGGTAEDWRKKMLAETWYTGKEALAAGLIDEITDPDEEETSEPMPANRLSLALFNYAGRAEAPSPETVETQPAPETETAPETAETEEDLPLHDESETLLAQNDRERSMRLLAAAIQMKG